MFLKHPMLDLSGSVFGVSGSSLVDVSNKAAVRVSDSAAVRLDCLSEHLAEDLTNYVRPSLAI